MGGRGIEHEGGGEREGDEGRDRRRERVEGGGKERNDTKWCEGEGGSRGRERWGYGQRDKEDVDQDLDKERDEGEWGGVAREGTW